MTRSWTWDARTRKRTHTYVPARAHILTSTSTPRTHIAYTLIRLIRLDWASEPFGRSVMDESNFHKINVIILFTLQTPSWLWDCVLTSQKESFGCHRKICIIIYRQPVSYCLEQLFPNRVFRLYYIIKLQQRGISVPQPTFSRAWSKKKYICNIYTKSSRHFEEWLWSPKHQGDAGFFVHERFYDNEILDSRSIRMFQMFKSWWNKIYKHDYSSIFSFKKKYGDESTNRQSHLYRVAAAMAVSSASPYSRCPFVADGADDKPFMVDMKEMSGYEKNLYLYSVSFYLFILGSCVSCFFYGK